MRVLVTRPLADAEATAVRLDRMGHQALLAPLLETQLFDGPAPDLSDVQAILATSANGVRALARRLREGRDTPLFAVGPQTAEEARNSGFADVRNANGDARALGEAAARWARPGQGALLHVSGEEAPGTLADTLTGHGFEVRKLMLYRVAAAAALPPEAARALASGTVDAALFFSPRSAKVFGDLATDFPLEGIIAVCISPATAAALTPLAFAGVRIAAAPHQDALLAQL